MKRAIYILSIAIPFAILFSCEKFEVERLTKVRTTAVSPDIVLATVEGQIIDLSGDGNNDYGFCYASHTLPTINDSVVSLGVPKKGMYSVTIQNLLPGEQYYVRAYCNDENGYIYGDVIPFNTGEGKIEFASIEVVFTSPVNAVVSANIVDDGGAQITARGVVWSTSQNPTLDDNSTVNGEGKGDYLSNISDLQSNTQYFTRTYATNVAGTFYGENLTFTTLEESTVVDIDGTVYQTVSINNRVWMAENLKVTSYNNGEPIPTGLDNTQWENTPNGAYTIYPHEGIEGIGLDAEILEAYGALYNWNAVDNPKGLCPIGWRLPTNNELAELSSYIAGINNQDIGNQLKSCRQVNSPQGGECNTNQHPRWNSDENHYGTDDFGLKILPGGMRYSNGEYIGVGTHAFFWTATQQSDNNSWYFGMYHNSGSISSMAEQKNMGYSVRCVKEW